MIEAIAANAMIAFCWMFKIVQVKERKKNDLD